MLVKISEALRDDRWEVRYIDISAILPIEIRCGTNQAGGKRVTVLTVNGVELTFEGSEIKLLPEQWGVELPGPPPRMAVDKHKP
jgi:hypothetical protein